MSDSVTRYNLELANEALKSERIASLEQQLSDTKAALRASTELLRQACLPEALYKRAEKLQPQIAANERLLGGGK